VLTSAQKQKLERMMGEKFEMPVWTPPAAPAQPKK
jgi:hypothetical protein